MSPVTSSSASSPAALLRIGVLGAAAIAPQAIIEPASAHPRVRVTAIAARSVGDARGFAARHSIPRVHESYDSLLGDPEIDAVYLPTPNGLHGRWTIAALEAGKHVLCEKPFTANAAEARAVASAASARPDLVVMEAFHWRYHPMATDALELIGRGALGRIESAAGTFCVPNLNRADIRWDERLAGGALMDLGCYPLHMLRTFLDAEPTVLAARAATRGGVDRTMQARLIFDGVPAMLRCSMLSRRPLSISLVIRGSGGTLRLTNPVQPHRIGRTRFSAARGSAERSFTLAADRVTTYRCQLDAFAAAVLDGAPVPTGIEDAIANMEAIDAIYRAAGMDVRRPTPD